MTERTPSLRGVLARRLWMLLPLLLASAVASFAVASFAAGEVFDRWLGDSVVSLARASAASSRADSPALPRLAVDMLKWDSVDRVYVQLITGPDQIMHGDPIPPPGQDLDIDEDATFYDTLYQGRRVRVAQVQQAAQPGAAQQVFRLAETLRKRRTLRDRLLLASIPLQACVLILAVLLLHSATAAGARAARQAAQRMADYDEASPGQALPRPLRGPSELQPAFDAMNALIVRLARAQQGQQRFISNAAHQLRTPLAVLQIQIESALRERDPARQHHAVQQTLAGLTRMRRLVEQLLTLNRSANAPDQALLSQPIDLAALAREEVEFHADRAIQAGTDLGYEGPEAPVHIVGEAQLLREALANLVDNAIQHGRHGGLVNVCVADGPPRLWVDDDGQGIAEQDRERVLERFARATSEGEGSGLGLAIVAEIATRHRAVLSIEASPAGGARVVLRFTKPQAATPSPK